MLFLPTKIKFQGSSAGKNDHDESGMRIAHERVIHHSMKAAIFDIDGTLTDSVHLHAKAWQETFRHFGHSISFFRYSIADWEGWRPINACLSFETRVEKQRQGD